LRYAAKALEAVYTRLVLRDLAAKIVPGAIVLAAVAAHATSTGEALSAVSGLSLPIAVVFVGAAWLAGVCVQSFGQIAGLIRLDPDPDPASVATGPRARLKLLGRGWRRDVDPRDRGERTRRILERARPSELRRLERLAATREAAGNAYVAVALVAISVIVRAPPGSAASGPGYVVPLASAILFAGLLAHAHFDHARREREWEDAILGSVPHPKAWPARLRL
jgi:hypothetical protein